MARIAKPLLTIVLLWLAALSTGAVPCRVQERNGQSHPARHRSGHRSHLPAKRGTTLLKEDEEVKPSRLLKVPALATVVPGPAQTYLNPRHDVTLAQHGFPGQPLYLTLRTLLI
jgi:hypothetical protein